MNGANLVDIAAGVMVAQIGRAFLLAALSLAKDWLAGYYHAKGNSAVLDLLKRAMAVY